MRSKPSRWQTSRSAACTCKSTRRDLTAFEMRLRLDIRRDTPAEMLNRVFAEGTYTRLLLALGRVAEASERAQIAKELATQGEVSTG